MTDAATRTLNATDGHVIAGALIDQNRFIGRMKAAQLFQLSPDPRDAENDRKRELSKELKNLQEVRQEVQRFFEGAKKTNVTQYAEYIVNTHKGEPGLTPAITLYTDQPLEVFANPDGTSLLQVPWDVQLVAIDGETQLAARHEAALLDPATRNDYVPVYIVFNRTTAWARQAFHDLNVLAVRPNTAVSMSMDARDPVTQIAFKVEDSLSFFKKRVSKNRRQLRSTDLEITTITGLRGAVATLAKGINGIKWGARPVPVEDDRIPYIETAALEWFKAVTEAIGPAIEDREHTVAGSNSVLAVIGALGSPLVDITDPAERTAKAKALADGLKQIYWERDKRWDGIAGKITPRGQFTVGGTKETAYAIHAALTDENKETYARIREVPKDPTLPEPAIKTPTDRPAAKKTRKAAAA